MKTRNTTRKNAKLVDLDFFEKIDTKEKAYILGLITADGSIDNNGYGFTFVSKDYELPNIIKVCMKSEHVISKYTHFDSRTNKNYTHYQIHISSKKITKDLDNLGFYNNKSFTCTFPLIPYELYWHYIRGIFDGDGCVYTNKKIGKLRLSIILSENIKNTIKTYLDGIGFSNTKPSQLIFENGILYSINYSAYKDIAKFKTLMYNDSDNIRLNRKYDIFLTLKEYKKGVYKRVLKPIMVIDTITKIITEYSDIHILCDKLNLKQRTVYKCLKYNVKTYKKYQFKYI